MQVETRNTCTALNLSALTCICRWHFEPWKSYRPRRVSLLERLDYITFTVQSYCMLQCVFKSSDTSLESELYWLSPCGRAGFFCRMAMRMKNSTRGMNSSNTATHWEIRKQYIHYTHETTKLYLLNQHLRLVGTYQNFGYLTIVSILLADYWVIQV